MKVLAVVVVVAAGFWFWQHRRHDEMQHRLSAVASELAGRPVHVDCQGFFAELVDVYDRTGDVQITNGHLSDTTHLTRKTCDSLNAFESAPSHPRLDCVVALDWARLDAGTILETECSRPRPDDGDAITTLDQSCTCAAGHPSHRRSATPLQEVAWKVVRLGGTPDEGAATARLVLAEQAPAMPADYQSSDCHAGGALDLHPQTPAFPTEAVPVLPPAGLFGPALHP